MTIGREQAEGAVVLRLEQGKVNALDLETLEELTATVQDLRREAAPPPLVLTGAGRAFSAGIDLSRVLDGGAAYIERLLPSLSGSLEELLRYPGPVVAAVNGAAIAGGCVLACAADRRLMAEGDAPIGATELVVGVAFPTAALEILRLACGTHVDEVVLTGRTYRGAEAVGVGLIHELVAPGELLGRALSVARELGRGSSLAYRMTKEQLRAPALARMAAGATVDAAVQEMWASPTTAEAIGAQLGRVGGRRD